MRRTVWYYMLALRVGIVRCCCECLCWGAQHVSRQLDKQCKPLPLHRYRSPNPKTLQVELNFPLCCATVDLDGPFEGGTGRLEALNSPHTAKQNTACPYSTCTHIRVYPI